MQPSSSIVPMKVSMRYVTKKSIREGGVGEQQRPSSQGPSTLLAVQLSHAGEPVASPATEVEPSPVLKEGAHVKALIKKCPWLYPPLLMKSR